jgi:hypothetical protein
MASKTLENLEQFTGTEHWYRHRINRAVLYTDGVKYVAEQAGAYWLIDEIALAQRDDANIKAEPFQVWKLSVTDSRATLVCEDGNDKPVFRKDIRFTDFPEPGVTLYYTDHVLLLPSAPTHDVSALL